MCAVRKCEEAPHGKAVEEVYGAKARRGTARKVCGGCVRCENGKRHRTESLRRMCTVRKREEAPHGKFAEDVYGAKTGTGTAQESCGECVRCLKPKKTNDKLYTEI